VKQRRQWKLTSRPPSAPDPTSTPT
jgi:hypothetical protein